MGNSEAPADNGKNPPPTKALTCRNETPIGSQMFPFVCQSKWSEDNTLNCEPVPESFSFQNAKRLKQNYPKSFNNGNGSKDPETSSRDPRPQNISSALLDSTKTNQTLRPPIPPTFNADILDKLVPAGDLFSDLQNELINVSMEKETLKIELMKAQAMINWLLSTGRGAE